MWELIQEENWQLWAALLLDFCEFTSGLEKCVMLGFLTPHRVVAAIVAQTIFMNKASDTRDPTFDFLPTVLCTQIVDALSIVTACIPYLKPLYLSIESGMLRSDDLLRNGVGIYAQGTACSDQSKSNRKKSSSKNVTPVRNLMSELQDLRLVSQCGEENNTTTVEATLEPACTWDTESHSSRTKIIRQTSTWNVNSELRSNEHFV